MLKEETSTFFAKVVRSKSMRSKHSFDQRVFSSSTRCLRNGLNQLLCGKEEGREHVPFCNSHVFRGLASASLECATKVRARRDAAPRAYDENSGTDDHWSLGCLELSKTRLGKAHPRKLILLRVLPARERFTKSLHGRPCILQGVTSRRLPIAREKASNLHRHSVLCASHSLILFSSLSSPGILLILLIIPIRA